MTALAMQIPSDRRAGNDRLDLLLGLWRCVLQTEDVALDSNFFDLGGDSLLAVTLLMEIERTTGRHLPITAIYDAQTVAEQALLLADDPPPAFSPLVLLKPGDGTSALFIFHGIGGTVLEFAKLGKLIDISGEVYAVQAQGVDGTLPPLDSLEDMAELYCRVIRQKQPAGPYCLCGYSFGGLTAIEVARRLRDAGEEIALLFLIDAYAHPVTWPRKSLLKVRLRRLTKVISSQMSQPFRIATVLTAAKTIIGKMQRDKTGNPVDAGARKRRWLLNKNPDLPLPLLETRSAAEMGLYRYKPRHYPGNAVFLKARYPDPDFPDDPRHVWRKLFKHLKVRVSPGSHLTIINEHAADVASHINACLREAGCAAAQAPATVREAPALVSTRLV
ncbi:MAG TPA: alpha/beta fold hydrolase [Rhizomicrobium sp.]